MKPPKLSSASLTRWSDIELCGTSVELQLDGVPVLRFTQESGPGSAQIELYPNIGPKPLAVSVTTFIEFLKTAQEILDGAVLDPVDES